MSIHFFIIAMQAGVIALAVHNGSIPLIVFASAGFGWNCGMAVAHWHIKRT